MVELSDIKPGMSVLEPSAGSGNIVSALIEEGGCTITAVEINSKLCNYLRENFTTIKNVINDDFFNCNGSLGMFDRVVMNPPFDKGIDIKHIQLALTFLKPGGALVALCANGPRQNDKLRRIADEWEVLPSGSFKGAGTGVDVAMLKITVG
jgi:16S rRNA G1207 methylase RsmC